MGYNRFQIACVFAEYELFKPLTTFIQNCMHTDIRISAQFYIDFSRQEHQKDVLKVSFNA